MQQGLGVLLSYLRALGLLIAVLILLAVVVALKRLLIGPLAHIPGPKLAAISNTWYAYHARSGTTASLAKSLHQQYGPVVRVGPSEVWLDTREAYDAIYGTGTRGYEKSDFYLATALARPSVDWQLRARFGDNLDLLSERDGHRYRLQRRLIGRVYRSANVVRHERAVDRVMDGVVAKLKGLGGEEIEMSEWMHIVAVECLGALVLSWSPGILRQATDRGTSVQSYLGWRRKSVFGLFPLVTKLEARWKWIGRIFATIWGITYQAPKGFKPFFPEVSRKVTRRIRNATKSTAEQRQDLLADLIDLHRDKPEFTHLYLHKMAITNFGAGHDTLASTLTAVMTMLGTHADVQARARAEVGARRARMAAEQKEAAALPYEALQNLTYTRAVVREAMRLHPVIGMSLPRVVPRQDSQGLELHGVYIPPGTTVGCNPASLHRNEDICGLRPDEFDPRRWLVYGGGGGGDGGDGAKDTEEAEARRIRVLERYSLSWGGGSRTCPGRHVAEMIVLKCVVRLLESFEIMTTLPEGEGATPTYFLSMLTGVRGVFRPISEGVK